MDASDIFCELSVKVYEPPLSLLREDGRIADLSNPLAVLMLVIDFETELSMSGINDYIGNSTGRYASATVDALNVLGCHVAAEQLATILAKSAEVGMTHEAIQGERQGLEPFSVTSFRELHGEKWDQVSEEIDELAGQIDFGQVLKCAEQYIDLHRQVILAALQQKSA